MKRRSPSKIANQKRVAQQGQGYPNLILGLYFLLVRAAFLSPHRVSPSRARHILIYSWGLLLLPERGAKGPFPGTSAETAL